MREVIPNRLWIGNARDARNVSTVLEAGVQAVIDLAIEEPPIVFPRDILYARIPLVDGGGNDPAMLRAALHTLTGLMADNVPTLVSCGGGMSRSPAIAAAALAIARCAPLGETLESLAHAHPHDVHPALWAAIHDAIHSTAITGPGKPGHEPR